MRELPLLIGLMTIMAWGAMFGIASTMGPLVLLAVVALVVFAYCRVMGVSWPRRACAYSW